MSDFPTSADSYSALKKADYIVYLKADAWLIYEAAMLLVGVNPVPQHEFEYHLEHPYFYPFAEFSKTL